MIKLIVHYGEDTRVLEVRPGQNLLSALAEQKISVYAPCKGNGRCKKCLVTLKTGGETRQVLSCRTAVTEDAEVWVPRITGGGLTEFEAMAWPAGETGVGAAVDIGTTTVAVALVDLSTGKMLGRQAMLNPQHVCGSDVISRITACAEGKLSLQRELIRKTVSRMVRALCGDSGIEMLKTVTVCGNTTMLHLFCGVDPTPIGVFPFTPVFTAMQTYRGEELELPAPAVYVLPSASGYIGSDVVCGIVAGDMDQGEPSLLADLGTNGELVLFDGKSLFAASTAAGPALEGANIECGIGGIPGAVCGVSLDGENLRIQTIENQPPVGICGSGLVDLMALLLSCGMIDETGSLDGDCGHPLVKYLGGDRFMVTEKLYLSQKDIRQFQLAKAAISAGLLTLCNYAGIAPEKISALYIAGGLGFYLSGKSAVGTGLIPPVFGDKIRVVGNSGLSGTARCLLPVYREKAARIADAVDICELNACEDFSERFVDSMSFDTDSLLKS